jgi:ureidoglycolate lyase
VPRSITPIPLTQADFKPFGDVIEPDHAQTRSINEGNTTRYHDLAELDLSAEGGRPGLNIFRSKPLPKPMILELMERHPLSSQTFYPLGNAPYLVVVATPGELDPSAIVAFLAESDQGVNYHKGTWHHYSLALGGVSDFLVIDRIADDQNCDEVRLTGEDRIEIDTGSTSR